MAVAPIKIVVFFVAPNMLLNGLVFLPIYFVESLAL